MSCSEAANLGITLRAKSHHLARLTYWPIDVCLAPAFPFATADQHSRLANSANAHSSARQSALLTSFHPQHPDRPVYLTNHFPYPTTPLRSSKNGSPFSPAHAAPKGKRPSQTPSPPKKNKTDHTPQSLLNLISLRTTTEFLILTLLVNKLTGLYGILALLTGYHLNPLQLSHYLYSLLVLALAAYLAPSLREPQQPLRVLALAWLYVLDAAVNTLYTALFGMGWFVLLAQHLDDSVSGVGEAGEKAPGAETIGDTAGFTDPEHDVEHVEVEVEPVPGALNVGQQATAFASGSGGSGGGVGSAVFQSGSFASLGVLGLLWVLKVWCCFVILAYARGVVRGYVLRMTEGSSVDGSAAQGEGYEEGEERDLAPNPFAVTREEGQGWRGKAGRVMLAWPTRGYWLGRGEQEEEWVRATSGRFSGSKGLRIRVPETGVGERERRARSGTGPPVPAVGLNGVKKEVP